MKGIVRANREALRSWMADQGEEEVDVRYSHRLVEVSGEPGDVVAKFENGSVHRGCFLVGADGVHSAGGFQDDSFRTAASANRYLYQQYAHKSFHRSSRRLYLWWSTMASSHSPMLNSTRFCGR
jgi:flavin-dependent dehydrogenase